jgi:hypothetical protein
MSKFRYVAVAPDRIEQRGKLGSASYLHDFLVDHQTDASGNVNYGKPFGYAWIAAHWANAPSLRTLKRDMARLKRLGHIELRLVDVNGSGARKAMAVKILGSVKFSSLVSVPAVQAPLFAPRIASMPCAKAVKNSGTGSHGVMPNVAPGEGQKWPPKEVRKELKKQTEAEPAVEEPVAVENLKATAPDREDEMREALATLRAIAKTKAMPETPVPGEAELIRRRDEQLRRMDEWTQRHAKTAAKP